LNNPNQIREVINFLKTSKFEDSEKTLTVLEFTSKNTSTILFLLSNQYLWIKDDLKALLN